MSSVVPEKTSAGAPAGTARRRDSLNLARRPFLNSRPVVRTALVLWLLGLGLLLSNVFLFRSYLLGSADKRAEIAQRNAAIAREQETNRQLERRLASFDLARQNEQIDFLNRRIAERTFSWSLLFDRLTDAMPTDVRLKRLTPKRDEQDRLGAARRRRQELPEDGRVELTISGESRNDEELLRFVDNLYKHPSFGEPNLTRTREEEEEGNLTQFEMTVSYIPGSPPRQAASAEETPVVVEEAPPGGAPQ